MYSSLPRRWSGVACVLCGLLLPVSWIMIELAGEARSTLTNSLDIAALTLLLFALTGIYGCQIKETGIYGFLGYILAMAAAAIALSLNWLPDEEELDGVVDVLALAMAIGGLVGYLLLGIGSWRAGILPRIAAFLLPVGWIISAVGTTVTVDRTSLEVDYVAWLQVAGVLVWAIGIIAAGVKLGMEAPEPEVKPSFG